MNQIMPILSRGVAKWAAIGAFVVSVSGAISWITATGQDVLTGKAVGVHVQRGTVERQTITVAGWLICLAGVAFAVSRKTRK